MRLKGRKLQVFSVRDAREARGTVFALHGDLDYDSWVQLEEAGVGTLAEGRGAGAVVVACDGLTFCDSSGISALLRLRQQLAAQDRVLRLSAVPASVARLFVVTGLDQIFDVYPDTEQALAAGTARRDIVAADMDRSAQLRKRQNP